MTERIEELLIATRNAGKVTEFRRIFADLPVRLVTAAELDLAEVVEDADSFEGNAIKKARELALASNRLTLADDSGLEVEALFGAPGVHSARYAGGGPEANMRKLLAAMENVPDGKRQARFRCVLALVDPASPDAPQLAHGTCEGRIIRAARGTGGFGYDPIFVVLGEDRTMAELTPEEKDSRSHRAIASRRMLQILRGYLSASTD